MHFSVVIFIISRKYQDGKEKYLETHPLHFQTWLRPLTTTISDRSILSHHIIPFPSNKYPERVSVSATSVQR